MMKKPLTCDFPIMKPLVSTFSNYAKKSLFVTLSLFFIMLSFSFATTQYYETYDSLNFSSVALTNSLYRCNINSFNFQSDNLLSGCKYSGLDTPILYRMGDTKDFSNYSLRAYSKKDTRVIFNHIENMNVTTNNNTKIIFDFKGYSSSTQPNRIGNVKLFLNYTNNKNVTIFISNEFGQGVSKCSVNNITGNQFINYTNWNTFVLDIPTIENKCSKSLQGYNLKESYIDFFSDRSDSFYTNILIDNFLVSGNSSIVNNITQPNINNSIENQLPTYNITYINNTQCVKNDSVVSNFKININAFDNEDDVILYATQQTDIKNIGDTIEFSQKKCLIFGLFCSESINEDYKKGWVISDSCDINLLEDVNLTKHNLVIDIFTPFEKYVLQYNSGCNGNPSFIYRFDKPITNLFYTTKINGLQQNNEEFNLTFYNFDFTQELMKVKFNVSGTQQNIYNWNGSEYNKVGNRSINNPLEFSIRYFGNLSDNKLFLLNEQGNPEDLIFNISTLSVDIPIKYVKLEVGRGAKATSIYQYYFTYSGIYPILNWGLEQPLDYSISGIGKQEVLLYVSDTEHYLNDVYSTTKLYFTNEEQQYCSINQDMTDKEQLLNGDLSCSFSAKNDSIWESLLLLFRLPYLMLCIGNINYLAGFIGLAILVFGLGLAFFKGFITTFKGAIMFCFVVGTLLLIMNFLIIPVYLIIVLLFGFSFTSAFMQGE